jgi:hypothetical protein
MDCQFTVPISTSNPNAGTVMLHMIFLSSLNEFPSYKKQVFSKQTVFICALLFSCEGQGFPLEYKKKEVCDNKLDQCPAQE